MTESQDEGRQLFCRIITPEGIAFDGEADLVIVRLTEGELGVMADHAPTVSAVQIGEVRVKYEGEWESFATSDGFFKVSENLAQVLVEEAVPAGEIDEDAAESRIAEADRGDWGEPEDAEEIERHRQEAERQRKIGENLSRVARRHSGG